MPRATLDPSESRRNFWLLLSHHAALALWFAWGNRLPLPIYVVLSILACLIHQRALSEWIHEAAHFKFVLGRKRNDRWIDRLAGVFFLSRITTHRKGHLEHHRLRQFFDDADPDTHLLRVRTRRDFRRAMLKDLTGLTALKMFSVRHGEKPSGSSPGLWPFLAAHIGMAGLLFLAGRIEICFFYYVTLGCLYPLLNRLRVYGQHLSLAGDGGVSRTIDAGFWDRLFFTSPRMLYHYEHHRFPAAPYRALPDLCERKGDTTVFSTSRWWVLNEVYRALPEQMS
jgi:fatty acid desaturase